MIQPDFAALRRVLEAFQQLGVRYLIGGSVASSIHGVGRPTQDYDVVAELSAEAVPALISLLGGEFYADEQAIRDAIAAGTSFNLISFESVDKVDVFVAGGTSREAEEMARGITQRLAAGTAEVRVTSPEDIVLRKLEWFRMGGGVSDRQWRDILGVLKVQRERFDIAYAARVAEGVGVGELLRKALVEAGLRAGA